MKNLNNKMSSFVALLLTVSLAIPGNLQAEESAVVTQTPDVATEQADQIQKNTSMQIISRPNEVVIKFDDLKQTFTASVTISRTPENPDGKVTIEFSQPGANTVADITDEAKSLGSMNPQNQAEANAITERVQGAIPKVLSKIKNSTTKAMGSTGRFIKTQYRFISFNLVATVGALLTLSGLVIASPSLIANPDLSNLAFVLKSENWIGGVWAAGTALQILLLYSKDKNGTYVYRGIKNWNPLFLIAKLPLGFAKMFQNSEAKMQENAVNLSVTRSCKELFSGSGTSGVAL